MNTSEQSAGSEGRLLASLTTIADISSKAIAGIAIALYACGFLIVSLHHSHYGFTEVNPFRPKVLAAGVWFFLFTGVPVAIVLLRGRLSWMEFAQSVAPYYVIASVFSYTAQELFNPQQGAPAQPKWWLLVIALLFFFLLVYLINSKRLPPLISALASVVFGIAFASSAIFAMTVGHAFDLSAITLWFFGVFVVTQFEVKMWPTNPSAMIMRNPVLPFVIALVVFALVYYQHMKSSVGGGSPVNVVLYFTKDSPIKPSQATSAQLIDESDAGFYIAGPDSSRAIFIPRSSVSLIYFSDKTPSEPLLK